jgi:hypothetical protein
MKLCDMIGSELPFLAYKFAALNDFLPKHSMPFTFTSALELSLKLQVSN